MSNNLLRIAGVLIFTLLLNSCGDAGRAYRIITEPIVLSEGQAVTREFSVHLENTKSVDLAFVFRSTEESQARFRINGNRSIEFMIEVDPDPDIPPDGVERQFNLPRSWFARNNTIIFEHLSGSDITVSWGMLTFNEFQTSPYEK